MNAQDSYSMKAKEFSNDTEKPNLQTAMVFAPQEHPKLLTLGRMPIHKFLRERDNYLLNVKEAQLQGSYFQPVRLVASIDTDLLQSLIDLETFPNVSNISELSDASLNIWLQERSSVGLEAVDDIDKLSKLVVKHVQMKVNEKDADCRIRLLFSDYKKFLRHRNMEDLTKTNPKLCVTHICSVLRPALLKQTIENHLRIKHADLKKNFIKFFKHVLEHGTVIDKYLPAYSKDSTENVKSQTDKEPTSTSSTTNNKKSSNHIKSSSKQKESSDNKKSEEFPFCLNLKKCPGERHWMKDCPNSSEEEKKYLKKHFWENKKKEKADEKPKGGMRRVGVYVDKNPTKVKPTSEVIPSGRISALLEHKLPVIVSGDYGADCAALSTVHIQQLIKKDSFLPICDLKDPITLTLAVDAMSQHIKKPDSPLP